MMASKHTCCWMAPTTALRVAPSGTAARGPRLPVLVDMAHEDAGAAERGSVLLSAVPTRGGSARSHEPSSFSCLRSSCHVLA